MWTFAVIITMEREKIYWEIRKWWSDHTRFSVFFFLRERTPFLFIIFLLQVYFCSPLFTLIKKQQKNPVITPNKKRREKKLIKYNTSLLCTIVVVDVATEKAIKMPLCSGLNFLIFDLFFEKNMLQPVLLQNKI